MTIWDIGANVGLYTLVGARHTEPTGHVYAFEPMPRNLAFLRHHINQNGLRSVTVVPGAVADSPGVLRMAEGDSPSEFHIDRDGGFEVNSIVLDRWFQSHATDKPDIVKIDVEGAEHLVLQGGNQVFQENAYPLYSSIYSM